MTAELGTIVDVLADRYVYRVKTDSGRSLEMGRKRSHPSDVSLLPIGTSVLVKYDLPFPYIDGVLDIPATDAGASAAVPVTGAVGFGGQGVSAGTGSGSNYRAANEPDDLIPGDSVHAHSSGSRVGALEGGLAVLVGSLLAQVRAHGLGDLVEIISRNFRHVTDFGVFEVKNKGGKVGLSFRGGTDQLTETGSDEERWTVRFDIGADADLLDFRLTTPTGENLFHVHVDGDGRCNVYAADGIVTRSGSASVETAITETAGSVEDRVGADRASYVGGSRSDSTGLDARHDVGGSLEMLAAVDLIAGAARDLSLSAGRRAVVDAQGDASSQDPAFELRARNGNMVFRAGHAPRPQGKIRMETLKGNIELASTQGGNVVLEALLGELRGAARKVLFDTQAPDSVILGGSALTGHVAIYEALERVLLFMAATYDSHGHPSMGAPPTTLMQPGVRGMVQNVKSRKVGVGG